jgi:DedD protein
VAPVEVRVVGRETARRSGPPEPTPGAAEAECFWVQVGAFGDGDNAARARDRLRAAGQPAVVIEGPGGLERVRVGPFDRRADAERSAARLRREWPSAQVVACGG